MMRFRARISGRKLAGQPLLLPRRISCTHQKSRFDRSAACRCRLQSRAADGGAATGCPRPPPPRDWERRPPGVRTTDIGPCTEARLQYARTRGFTHRSSSPSRRDYRSRDPITTRVAVNNVSVTVFGDRTGRGGHGGGRRRRGRIVVGACRNDTSRRAGGEVCRRSRRGGVAQFLVLDVFALNRPATENATATSAEFPAPGTLNLGRASLFSGLAVE